LDASVATAEVSREVRSIFIFC